jgi:hypothetical protein
MTFVKLTTTQKITHYLFPALMFLLGCIPFYHLVLGKTNQNLTPSITLLVMSIFWLATLGSFIKQRNGLRFYSISTGKTVKLNMQITRKILRETNWQITKSTSNFIQAEGLGFRDKVDFRSWGELLTIQLRPNEILVNSICNPDGKFAQFVSFGKNKQNLRDFEMLYLQELLAHGN